MIYHSFWRALLRLLASTQETRIPRPAADGSDRGVIVSVLAVWKGEALVRMAIVPLVIVALAACSDSTPPPPPSDPTASAAILKKDCSDPHWREENLGLWYSVCRQPLRW